MKVISKERWIFLSYELHDSLSMYGNGERIKIKRTRSISGGDTSNNSHLTFHSHYGTHIDFPNHFDNGGKTGTEYQANSFIFNQAQLTVIMELKQELLIELKDLVLETIPVNTELLIIKTGFTDKRMKDEYWSHNPGFAPQLAKDLKKKLPELKAIGFDSISLTSYQHREIGRIAHREFLVNNDLLIIEDMDLSKIDEHTTINTVIVSPLRFKDADGTPVTVFAQIVNS